MSKLAEFQQRQQPEFRQLVYKAVTEQAFKLGTPIEDYIQHIYYHDMSPPTFVESSSLLVLYRQYTVLINAIVITINGNDRMTDCSKTYFCYRIYLHGMVIKLQVMSEDVAIKSLIFTMREFFYTRGRILTLQDEVKLGQSISLVANQEKVCQAAFKAFCLKAYLRLLFTAFYESLYGFKTDRH